MIGRVPIFKILSYPLSSAVMHNAIIAHNSADKSSIFREICAGQVYTALVGHHRNTTWLSYWCSNSGARAVDRRLKELLC